MTHSSESSLRPRFIGRRYRPAAALAVFAAVGCGDVDAERGPIDLRSAEYTVTTEIDDGEVVTDVRRDGTLVAEALSSSDGTVLTLLASDAEVELGVNASFAPDADLESYEHSIVDATRGLELLGHESSAEEVEFRLDATCTYIEFEPSGYHGYCVSSWCTDGCMAIDCVYLGGAEFHIIQGCGVPDTF